MTMQQILLMFIKWSNLQKSVSKFTPKLLYEIDPGLGSWPYPQEIFHYGKNKLLRIELKERHQHLSQHMLLMLI
jgi:hypothetical protein